MPLPQPSDRIDLPPLGPGGDPIDREHLRRATLGDTALEREVLAMFLNQSAQLLGVLVARPSEGSTYAHTLQGSARAIGAFGVAANACALEAAIRNGGDPTPTLAALEAAIAEARVSIAAILQPS